jgi:hypothetical protein
MLIEAATHRGNRKQVEADKYPDHCPLCHYGIEALYQGLAHIFEAGRRLELVFRCPREQCQSFFISRYSQRYLPGSQGYFYAGSCPLEPARSKFSIIISKLSPEFCEIFNQSQNAEGQEWSLIAGPGYRKALEFLVKDYLCAVRPAEADKIKALQLGPCIENFADNDKIKQMAKRAAWLGNDETHYVRKWEDKDLEDLKALIRLTLHWIEMEQMTRDVLQEMPEGKK